MADCCRNLSFNSWTQMGCWKWNRGSGYVGGVCKLYKVWQNHVFSKAFKTMVMKTVTWVCKHVRNMFLWENLCKTVSRLDGSQTNNLPFKVLKCCFSNYVHVLLWDGLTQDLLVSVIVRVDWFFGLQCRDCDLRRIVDTQDFDNYGYTIHNVAKSGEISYTTNLVYLIELM